MLVRVAAPVLVAGVAGVLLWLSLQPHEEAGVAEVAERARVRVEDGVTRRHASGPELAPLESVSIEADAAVLPELLRLNKRALESLAARDFEAAVRDFRAALDLQPGNEIILLNLSRTLAQWGEAELRAGNSQHALSLLEEAAQLHRDGGENGSMLAYGLLRVGRRDRASSVLAATLEQFPDSVPALRLAGEVAFLRGELGEAIGHLERASDLVPGDAAIARRLDAYRTEQEQLSTFLRTRSTRFECMYPADDTALRPHLEDLLLDLEQASDTVNQLLGLAPTDRILVILMSPEAYRAGAPTWSNGLYDGRIRIPIEDYTREAESVRATFRHEYTHAALQRVGPVVPTWLHEGLAQYVEGRSVDRARQALRARPRSAPSVDRLRDDDWTRWTDQSGVEGAYAYALSLSGWLVDEYGADALSTLVRGLETAGVRTAFEMAFGDGFEVLEARHRAALLGAN